MCWSPDGRYIVAGGQDDLVLIWSFAERRVVARCEGHHSWVSSVAFDPWRCDERTYRFGSVGNDCRLLLWDFSVGMLHKPKAVRHSIIGLTLSLIHHRRHIIPGVAYPQPLRQEPRLSRTGFLAGCVAKASRCGSDQTRTLCRRTTTYPLFMAWIRVLRPPCFRL